MAKLRAASSQQASQGTTPSKPSSPARNPATAAKNKTERLGRLLHRAPLNGASTTIGKVQSSTTRCQA